MLTTHRKLILGGAVLVGVSLWMAWLGAASSWQYYLTTDECLADRAHLAQSRLRINGKIAAQSITLAGDHRGANFALQGAAATLPVCYTGNLPDTPLTDNMELVVEGRFDGQTVQADKLITRCATKYRAEAVETETRTAARPTGAPH